MRIVIKRSGHEEPYDREKLYISLRNTSDDLLQPLGGRDIDSIIYEVETILADHKKVHTLHLHYLVAGVLCVRQFFDIAQAYATHSANAYRV